MKTERNGKNGGWIKMRQKPVKIKIEVRSIVIKEHLARDMSCDRHTRHVTGCWH